MNKALRGIVLSSAILFLAGCSTFRDAIIDAIGGKFLQDEKYKFIQSFDLEYKFNDFNFFDKPDKNPEKPIFLFFYGWGGCEKEFLDEEKNNKNSRLRVMKDVFENRVVLASYPSSFGMENVFAGIETPFLNFIEKYSCLNSGKKPEFVIAGHSLGAELARMFARKYPEYIEKAGLIAGVNNGINVEGFIKQQYPEYVEGFLIKNKKSPDRASYRTIDDLIEGSPFLLGLNTSTSSLNVEYDFYAFIPKEDNWFIPGPDDGVASITSTYPYDLIKERRFENVKIGDAIIFRNYGHFAINENLEVFKKILESIKSEKEKYMTELPSINNAITIYVR